MNISGKTRVCALIGDPVEHTMSPLIHNNLAAFCGIDLVYVPMRVAADSVDSAVRGAYDLGVLGLNVTVPHKIAVMDSLADIDEHAAAIGAVNTLVRSDKGYIGYNTDYIGLKRALADDGISLSGRDVVVLGAGGAARAAAFLCAFEHAGSVHILNRSVDKAEALCNDVNAYILNSDSIGNTKLCKPVALTDHSSVPGDELIVLQASSVGLFPNINDVIIDDESFYERISYGYDLVYNPADTRFMQLVRTRGGCASNGLKMLLYQGICGFEFWNGITVSQDAVEQVLDKLESAARPKTEQGL